ncbi:hypothetical protein KBD08_01130 [Candidatus Babeliales bacterium]|nr:hypothetical protein [Candidatus Babeliales bacterium]
MKKTFNYIMLLVCFSLKTYTVQVSSNDPNAATNTTFSFNVGFVKYDPKSDTSFARWWTANQNPIASDDSKPYGLSFIVQAASYINPGAMLGTTPMTNENATLLSFVGDRVAATSATNPMWGNAFTNFDVSMHKPVFTVDAFPTAVYAVENIEHYENPTEKKPNVTNLLTYDFGVGNNIAAIQAYATNIYTAYATGVFGTGASAVAVLGQAKGLSVNNDNVLPYLTLLKSEPITTSTAALKAGGPDLASFGPQVNFGFASRFTAIGLEATSAAGGVAVGAMIPMLTTIVTGNTTTYSLDYISLVKDAAVAGVDTAISAYNGNTIRIKNINTLQTSTNLIYIVFVRDDGAAPETIYALPLVTTGTDFGKIADYTKVATRFGSTPTIFIERNFTTALTDPTQINPANAAIINQIRVGGANPLPIDAPNLLQDMYVVGDSVYAVIGNVYTATQAPGTYRSQAIMAPEGHIVGWTPWTRVLGTDKQMKYSFVDGRSLSGFYLAAQTPGAIPNFNTLYQTTFNADTNLSPFLSQSGMQGLQGVFNFGQTTPGFNNAISLLIGASHNMVSIGQTGDTTTVPHAGFFGPNVMTGADVLTFTGADINDHTALVAAEIAHNGANHWVFAGGMSGVSVLTDDAAGYSWTGNLASVAGLNAGQTWKTVGDFSQVKKLVWDQTYIYILTTSAVYRIALDPNKFKATPTADLNIETVITSSELNSNMYFLTMIIDNGYMLLGTTDGLYKIESLNVSKITIPQGLPAISQIIAIPASTAGTPNPNREFKNLSNLIILDNTFGTQQARIHRFAIQNGVVESLPDMYAAQPGSTTQGKLTAFLIFDTYVSSYFTDGSWNIANSYFIGIDQPSNSQATPFVQQLFSSIRSGISSSHVILPMLSAYSPLTFIAAGTNILGMVRESTAGALICAGDFQAHANA